jgi:hypothetical protein
MPCGRRKRTINGAEDMNDNEDIIENEIANDTGILLDNDNALSDDEDLGKKKEDFFSLSTSAKEMKKASINFYSYEFDHILKGEKGE